MKKFSDVEFQKVKIKNKLFFFVNQKIIEKFVKKHFSNISFLRSSHLKKLNNLK